MQAPNHHKLVVATDASIRLRLFADRRRQQLTPDLQEIQTSGRTPITVHARRLIALSG